MRDLLLAILAAFILCSPAFADPVQCPERGKCRGCGCKGGPGYRAPDNHCVSFRELEMVCGVDPDDIGAPSPRCRFENLPNTGANRWCAFGLIRPR